MDGIVSVIGALYSLKTLYDDVEGNKNDCQYLINRCLTLEKPLKAIQANEERLKSCQEALGVLKAVLDDCVKFCSKYTGKRWLVKAFRNIHQGDKEKFIELNNRISASSSDLQLGISAVSVATMSVELDNMRVHVGDDLVEIKQRMNELSAMLLGVLQAKQDGNTQIPEEYLANIMKNSAKLISLAESEEHEIASEHDESSPSTHTAASNCTVAATGSNKSNKAICTLSIDFPQLVWKQERCNLLGSGSFGEVYKCTYMSQDCALKLCAGLGHQQLTKRELFKIQREARIMQLASFHPNVIAFRGVCIEKGILLMELAVCSLYELLHWEEKRDSLPITEVEKAALSTTKWKVSIMQDVINAINFLHFHGVLHRDVKSANIMLVLDPRRAHTGGAPLVAKVSDFGLASAAGMTGGSVATKTDGGRGVGSAPYMAPELLDFETAPFYSPAVDVYAYGIVANELLTEKIPWLGLKEVHIFIKVINKRERPVLYKPTSVLEQQVMHVVGNSSEGCLHQDPSERPSASTICQQLAAYVSDFKATEGAADHVKLPSSTDTTAESSTSSNDPKPQNALLLQIEKALLAHSLPDVSAMLAASSEQGSEGSEIVSRSSLPPIPPPRPARFSSGAGKDPVLDNQQDPSSADSVTPGGDSPGLKDDVRLSGSGASSVAKPAKPAKPRSGKTQQFNTPTTPSTVPPAVPSVAAVTSQQIVTPDVSVAPEVPVIPVPARATTSTIAAADPAPVEQPVDPEAELHGSKILVIVEALSSTGAVDKVAALKDLGALALTNQELVVTLGAVPLLVSLLTHGAYDEVYQACLVLGYLADGNVKSQRAIVAAGGLQPLVLLLSPPADADTQECAAAVLMYLIVNNVANQKELCALKALPALIGVLVHGSGPKDGISAALRVLADIAESHRDVPAMVSLLEHADEDLQQSLTQFLGILAEGGAAIQTEIVSAGAILVLLAQLQSTTCEPLREHTASTLCKLTHKHAQCCNAIAAAGIPAVVALLHDGQGTAKASGMHLLHLLVSSNPAHRAAVNNAGAVGFLKIIRDSHVNSAEDRHQAEALLTELGHWRGFTVPNFIVAKFA